MLQESVCVTYKEMHVTVVGSEAGPHAPTQQNTLEEQEIRTCCLLLAKFVGFLQVFFLFFLCMYVVHALSWGLRTTIFSF